MGPMSFSTKKIDLLLLLCSVLCSCNHIAMSSPDYQKALHNTLLFFEGQRSGPLPSSQRVSWRANSALHDGLTQGVDLVGGYYDAGDNVKYGLPMAFTVTMLSWSVLEYGKYIASAGELGHALEAIKWGTDYFIKAHPEPNLLWGEVGDGDTDHYCWQRPEEMTTSRQAYKIDSGNPGSDLAGETAAAMAAASLVFKHSDSSYAQVLLSHAKQLFSFADTYRGRYDSSITVARNYYQSESGYDDELLWAALWLYEATSDQYYLNYVIENAESLGGTGWAMTEFSWDVKYAGLQVLAAKILFQNRGTNGAVLEQYRAQADFFACACLQKNYGKNVRRTPGGLIYTRAWNNMQYVSSASFLMAVYSDYLSASKQSLRCQAGEMQPSELLDMAKSQVDYILGDNPRGTSYMVGYGVNFPQRIHHRAASIVSYKIDRSFVACRVGYQTWYSSSSADPNVHVGALVGGPDENDNYADDRVDFDQSEPATYNSAPLLGVLARLSSSASSSSSSYAADGRLTTTPPSTPVSKPRSSPVARHASSSPSEYLFVSQRMTKSWVSSEDGKTHQRYQATIKNNSARELKRLSLSLYKLQGPIWGLSRTGPQTYSFPAWLKSLPAGQALVFVYIHPAPKANIAIASATFA